MGIDPGLSVTGYGIIEKDRDLFRVITSGGIKTASGQPVSKRLSKIFSEIVMLIENYQPSAVAIEDTFIAKNPQIALKLGQARGIALLAAENANIPVFEYSPRTVKQSVVGHGAAGKDQIQYMMKRLLNNFCEVSQHASDALAVAVCHYNSNRIKELIAREA